MLSRGASAHCRCHLGGDGRGLLRALADWSYINPPSAWWQGTPANPRFLLSRCGGAMKGKIEMISKDEQIHLLKTNIPAWNDFRKKNPDYFLDLSDADLSDAYLSDAYLNGAYLYRAYLNRANLKNCKHDYLGRNDLIVPKLFSWMLNQIESKSGKLSMRTWHDEDCKTTHCMAGWAITAAGKAGEELEDKIGPSAAGAIIVTMSALGLDWQVPNWTASDEDAMDFIKECAEKEREAV